MTVFIKKIVFPTLIFIAIFVIVLHFISDTNTANNYTLKAYKNTVALYNGEEIITIYNNIVLNTLPKNDIQNFRSGIVFSSLEQVSEYLEDFDN